MSSLNPTLVAEIRLLSTKISTTNKITLGSKM